MNTRPERGAAFAAAGLGAAVTFALFWPGWMSVDSAVQYAQAIGLRPLDDVVPPLMTLAWRGLDRLVAGPGGIFAVLVLAWWSGLAACVASLRSSRASTVAAVLGLGLFPPTLVVMGHVWKDVAMVGALLWAVAALAAHAREPRMRWRTLALLALAIACAMRPNAIFAVLPLLAVCCAGRHGLAKFVLLAAVLAVFPGVLHHALRARPTQAWTVVALWDLAALSIAADEVLIPAEVSYSPITVEELRGVVLPYANPPLFDLGKIQVSLYVPYTPSQVARLQRAWLAAVASHPFDYLAHRARLARYLLFGFPRELPRELVYVPERIVLPGTPYAPPPVPASRWHSLIESLRPTPVFGGALYLAIAGLALVIARRERGLAWALAGSSVANTLPLLAISGSAEFRYLAWSVVAAWLALLFALVGRRRAIG